MNNSSTATKEIFWQQSLQDKKIASHSAQNGGKTFNMNPLFKNSMKGYVYSSLDKIFYLFY